jgi:hypothetical protein
MEDVREMVTAAQTTMTTQVLIIVDVMMRLTMIQLQPHAIQRLQTAVRWMDYVYLTVQHATLARSHSAQAQQEATAMTAAQLLPILA